MANWTLNDLLQLSTDLRNIGTQIGVAAANYKPSIDIEALGVSALVAIEQGAVTEEDTARVRDPQEMIINL